MEPDERPPAARNHTGGKDGDRPCHAVPFGPSPPGRRARPEPRQAVTAMRPAWLSLPVAAGHGRPAALRMRIARRAPGNGVGQRMKIVLSLLLALLFLQPASRMAEPAAAPAYATAVLASICGTAPPKGGAVPVCLACILAQGWACDAQLTRVVRVMTERPSDLGLARRDTPPPGATHRLGPPSRAPPPTLS